MSASQLDLDRGLGPAREVRLSAGPIRYRERGEGPPVLLVHGLLVNAAHWRKVVPRLNGVRSITPDWPLGSHELPMNDGADLSPPAIADLIAEFMDTLELDDVTLVGNDTGGALCQLVVTRRPERVGRLVLCSCDAYEVFPPALFKPLVAAARIPGAVGVIARTMHPAAARRLPLGYGWTAKRLLDQELVEHYLRPLRGDGAIRRDAARFLAGSSSDQTLDAAARFGEFDRPVLVAWGADDRFFDVSLGERLAAAFPRARFELIEDAATFVTEDQPERLAGLIDAFVREDAPERQPVA